MPQLSHDPQTTQTFRGALGIVAGILPLMAIGAYDIAGGAMVEDSVYEWQVIVGPPLIAAACAPWVGARGVAQIALIGVLTAALAMVALWFLLIGVGFGA